MTSVIKTFDNNENGRHEYSKKIEGSTHMTENETKRNRNTRH